jgi:hypothetical protein
VTQVGSVAGSVLCDKQEVPQSADVFTMSVLQIVSVSAVHLPLVVLALSVAVVASAYGNLHCTAEGVESSSPQAMANAIAAKAGESFNKPLIFPILPAADAAAKRLSPTLVRRRG